MKDEGKGPYKTTAGPMVLRLKSEPKNHVSHPLRGGQAFIVILIICLILGILVGAVVTFVRGQTTLLSKSAKDYLALCAAEAGINCVLAEMRVNPQFVTHGNSYIPEAGWTSPAKHRPFVVGETEGLELDHPARGTYTGRMVVKKTRNIAEFKVRVKLVSAKNSLDTKTVEEAHRYFLLEAAGKVDDSCRIITAVLEKYSPAAYLLYDGQVLDVGGYGPYRVTPGQLKRGRLYGQELIKFSKRGVTDAGTDCLDMEKISTPGHIKTSQNAFVSFRNGKEGRLKPENDSTTIENFQTYPEESGKNVLGKFVLDGMHGGKSEKFPPLNPKYYRDATDPRPTILSPGAGYDGFSESKWRNPGKPTEVVYDLDFGWEYHNQKEKILLYSTVPLRIWGNPPSKAMTIFCEKDVYMAGDFNANPENPQNYDLIWRDYTDPPDNGTDKNGVMILSQGRIWFDYSNPLLFLRNEMGTMLDYEMAMRLGGKDMSPAVLMPFVYPHRFTTGSDPRLPLTSLNFGVISNLNLLPKEPPQIIPLTLAGIAAHPSLKELREYFDPSTDPQIYRQRFCIKSGMKRAALFEKIGAASYLTGILTKGERDSLIRGILNEAQKELLEDDPDPSLGPWNVADHLFKLAFTHPKLGFRMPEMTVNALLIDSAELNAKWNAGDGADKVLDEIGNVQSTEARSFPYVFSQDTRILLRHMGGMIHLRTKAVEPFLDGRLRNDSSIVRRNIWDSTFVAGGGDYHPPYMSAAFNLVAWQDDAGSLEQFDAIR